MTVFYFILEVIPTSAELFFFFCVMAENIVTNPNDIL